ncbi:Hypothetical predicted protein [Pelobates cultripes]|uniref:Uncharacterized protein n=1 Tax=Pelobates cultripes TaxID=61616 RepID=A0AAD1WX63_PELCU|nr:Hypothetical predicted protein [Pelobates cultripes]
MGHSYRTCPKALNNIESIWSMDPVEMDSAGLGEVVAGPSAVSVPGMTVSRSQPLSILPLVSNVTSEAPVTAASSRPHDKVSVGTSSTGVVVPESPGPSPTVNIPLVKTIPLALSPESHELVWKEVKSRNPPPSKVSAPSLPQKTAKPPAVQPQENGDVIKGGKAKEAASSSVVQDALIE